MTTTTSAPTLLPRDRARAADEDTEDHQIHVIVDWFDDHRRRVPLEAS